MINNDHEAKEIENNDEIEGSEDSNNGKIYFLYKTSFTAVMTLCAFGNEASISVGA